MPKNRMADAGKTTLRQRSCGIIRITALCPLCRSRHNGHHSGHVSRLNRNFSGRFGGEAYAREELVAELCSAFLCAELGVTPTVRHADYLGAWLEVLKGDNRAIFQAASMASKAADFVMGRRDAGRGQHDAGEIRLESAA